MSWRNPRWPCAGPRGLLSQPTCGDLRPLSTYKFTLDAVQRRSYRRSRARIYPLVWEKTLYSWLFLDRERDRDLLQGMGLAWQSRHERAPQSFYEPHPRAEEAWWVAAETFPEPEARRQEDPRSAVSRLQPAVKAARVRRLPRLRSDR